MAGKTIAEVIAEGRLRTFMDRRLIKALGHPVREHILMVLSEQIASPSEIGRELGLEVERFYHHFEVLEALGCIERVETKRRRGATEHFFRMTVGLLLDDGEWARLPETLRADLSAGIVKPIFDDVAAAIRSQSIDARNNHHMNWAPAHLDEQGWREVLALLRETLGRAMAIRKRSTRRLAQRGERGTPASVTILDLEVPSSEERTKKPVIRRRTPAHVRRPRRASAR